MSHSSRVQNRATKRAHVVRSLISGGHLSAGLSKKNENVFMGIDLNEEQKRAVGSHTTLFEDVLRKYSHIFQHLYQELQDYLVQGGCDMEMKKEFIVTDLPYNLYWPGMSDI